jgi:hypothetical protein
MGEQDEKFLDYIKMSSDKMFITGNAGCSLDNNADNSSSKKKKKKDDKCKIEHDILYYIDKDDPLGPTEPNYNDPMAARWDAGIGQGGDNSSDKKK